MQNKAWPVPLAKRLGSACGAFVLAACAAGPHHGTPSAVSGEGDVAGHGSGTDIGFPSVAAARAALEARDDVEIIEQDGWTLIEEPESGTVWNFTPSDHPAHPTVVKRTIVKQAGKDDIEMRGRCEATREACETLIRKLEYQNAKLTDSPMRLYQKPTGTAADLPPIGGLLR